MLKNRIDFVHTLWNPSRHYAFMLLALGTTYYFPLVCHLCNSHEPFPTNPQPEKKNPVAKVSKQSIKQEKITFSLPPPQDPQSHLSTPRQALDADSLAREPIPGPDPPPRAPSPADAADR